MTSIFALMAKILGTIVGLILLGAGLWFLLAPKAPKPPQSIAGISELEAYLERATGKGTPPGLSLAVVKDGRMVYSRGSGLADGPRAIPAGPDTVYHWWSMTKIPTAIAILQLQERGLLSIDDPVTAYLPFFRVNYPAGERPAITLRHLLNHSSGLRDNVPEITGWVHWEGDPPRNQTELLQKKLPAYAGLIFTPGERTQYSNVGYMVLGAVIEAVSGQSYEAFVLENILQPLGMDRTKFIVDEEMAAHEAAGSQHTINPFTPLMIPLMDMNALVREREGMRLWFNRVYNDQTPPTGLIGPVNDAARLILAYLNEGELDGARVLSPASVALMSSQSQLPMRRGGDLQGLGWKVHRDGEGRTYLYHAGGGPGFATEMRVYPQQGLGIVVMGNDTTFDVKAILDLAASLGW